MEVSEKDRGLSIVEELHVWENATHCNIWVHRCGAGGSMRACHKAGSGSIHGQDKFPGWGFISGFFLTSKTNVGAKDDCDFRISDLVKNSDGTDI